MKKQTGTANAKSAKADPNSSEATRVFTKAAKAFTKEHTRSAQTAKKALVELGIVTKSGRLSRNYGG